MLKKLTKEVESLNDVKMKETKGGSPFCQYKCILEYLAYDIGSCVGNTSLGNEIFLDGYFNVLG